MNPVALLERIARTLKQDIGPAVEAEYPKTQAFMAAVVLDKLARQLRLETAHGAADAADLEALLGDLREPLDGGGLPVQVVAAVRALASSLDAAGLAELIAALYASRAELGPARFDALLGRVRQTLRASIDRRMEYSG